MRFALRMVSRRDVAVMICDDPAVSEVYRYRFGSVWYDLGVESAIIGDDKQQIPMLIQVYGIFRT